MAINKNHEFEELDGVKCGIVERNVLPERVQFLQELLTYNGYTVKVIPTPAPKGNASPVAPSGETPARDPQPPALEAPKTFTVGVTDYTFNSINAIFGRLLKTTDGHVVTLAFWQQKDPVSKDDIPYFDHKDS